VEPDPALAAVTTYNHLRLALAALVLLLFGSVALEAWAAGGCLQPSISAYYYTPAGPVLIGVLVAVGVCLIALRGNTDAEDVLMNLAGMLAPGVALIPTPDAGSCSSAPLAVPDTPSTVANAMPALFVTGAVVGVAALVIARREGTLAATTRWTRAGILLTVALLAAGAVWFVVDRDGFLDHGHGAAAVPMFLAVVVVVWLNARDVQQSIRRGAVRPEGVAPGWLVSRRRYVGIYRVIAVGMLLALAATVVITTATGSTSLVFWVEVVLIVLFAVFWVVQTVELWNRGLRRP
jgi:hypothetical protein